MIHSLCPCSHAGWNTNRDHAGMKGQSDRIVPDYITHKVFMPPLYAPLSVETACEDLRQSDQMYCKGGWGRQK